MLSDETLQQYREMTPAQRLKLTFELIEEGWRYMLAGPPEVVARKRALWEQENDLANQRIWEGLSRQLKTDDQQPLSN